MDENKVKTVRFEQLITQYPGAENFDRFVEDKFQSLISEGYRYDQIKYDKIKVETYQEGDEIHVCFLQCHYCHRKAIQIHLIDVGIIRDDTDVKVSGYCPYYESPVPSNHTWIYISGKYYVYRNGQWVEKSS